MAAQRGKAAVGSPPCGVPLCASAFADRVAALGEAPAHAQAHRRQHRQVAHRRGLLVVLGFRCLFLVGLEHAQKKPRLGAQPGTLLRVAALPRDVQALHLPHARALARQAAHERLTVGDVGPGQRYETLGRRLHRELAGAHHLLHRLRQRAHQRQAPAHPARRSIEPSRQLLLPHPVSLAQLAQEPSFFESRARAAVVEPVPEHQRFGLGHVHRRRVDQVARELAQRRDAHVAVDEHPRGAVAYDEYRRLLAVLEQ